MRIAQLDEQVSLWRASQNAGEFGWEPRDRMQMISFLEEEELLTYDEARWFEEHGENTGKVMGRMEIYNICSWRYT